MGWLFYILAAAVLLLTVWRLKMPSGGLAMVGAALALAGAGYAAQGQPSLEAAPGAESGRQAGELASLLIDIRQQMDRNFGPHKVPLGLADGALRRGDTRFALAAISGGLKNDPGNPELLNARAVALYVATEGELTPAVQLAFEQARAGSDHPGPDYFEGLARLFDDEPEAAERLWTSALQKGAPSGEWRANVEAQLSALREMRAAADRPMSNKASDSGTSR